MTFTPDALRRRRAMKSAECFQRLVWPVMAQYCGGGVLRHVEVQDEHLAREMDQVAGVDAIQVFPGECMRIISSRVQFVPEGRRPHETFTMGSYAPSGVLSELEKRILALDQSHEGWLTPFFTIQAFVAADGSRLRSAAVCRTSQLVTLVRNGRPGVDFIERVNPENGRRFVAIQWKRLLELGIWVKVHLS
jgi:hypothetical protein